MPHAKGTPFLWCLPPVSPRKLTPPWDRCCSTPTSPSGGPGVPSQDFTVYCSFLLYSSANALALTFQISVWHTVTSESPQDLSYFPGQHGNPGLPPTCTALSERVRVRAERPRPLTTRMPLHKPTDALPCQGVACPPNLFICQKIQNVRIQVIQRGPAHRVHLVRKHTARRKDWSDCQLMERNRQMLSRRITCVGIDM